MASRLDVASKQRLLKVGGLLIFTVGLGTLGLSQIFQHTVGCDYTAGDQCYTAALFAELFGFLMFGVGSIAWVVSKNLPTLEKNWSMPKEERMALRRMPREQW